MSCSFSYMYSCQKESLSKDFQAKVQQQSQYLDRRYHTDVRKKVLYFDSVFEH